MIHKIIRGVFAVLGAVVGVGVFIYVIDLLSLQGLENNLVTYVSGIIVSSLIGGALFFAVSPWLMQKGSNLATKMEKELSKLPLINIVTGSVGLLISLSIAFLVSRILNEIPIPFVGMVLSIILYVLMAYLGITVSTKKTEEWSNLFSVFKKGGARDKGKAETVVSPKILDTSVIIDGRIADICKTGFVEGPLIIPEFVLEELRHIADSSDSLKRNRGRRGLDILNKIQKELDIEVRIENRDFEELSEVDTKLLKLAQVMDGKVLTNDYNLNKVAEFQGVAVLNINELANAVKPVVLPGEEMLVQVIKDGKESGQGLAYLDDGTMIVVDSGKKFIGKNIDVLVTSVLQTAAGRMIFAKPKSMADKSA